MSSPPTSARALRAHALALLAIAFATIAAYGNALHQEFVWDDIPLIQQDDRLRSLDRLGHIFTNDFFARSEEAVKYGYYRPLVTLSYAADRAVYGLSPRGFHVTNLVLHLLCSALVYAFAVRLLALRRLPALAGALLFAVHPVHTESVTWISGRTDVLATLFILAGCLAHGAAHLEIARPPTRKQRNAWIALATLLLLLALLCKELAVAFPVLVVILSLGRMPLARALRTTAPYLAAIGAYLVFRFVVVDVATNAAVDAPLGTYVLTLARTFFRYALELIWPFPLSAYILNPWVSGLPAGAVLAVLGCAAYGGLVYALLRRGRHTAACLMLGFAASLGPVSNLLHISAPADMGFVMAERFLYLPSLFFCLGAGALLFVRPGLEYAGIAVLAGALIGGAAATRQRNDDYRDEAVFMARAIEQAPDAPLLHARLGAAQSLSGRHEQAIQAFERADALLLGRTGKSDPAVAADLGAALRRGGQLDRALATLEEVRGLGFDAPSLHFNIGETLRLLGRHEQAEAALRRALNGNPHFAEAHLSLARLLAARRRYDQALGEHAKALAIVGDDAGLYLAGGDLQRMRGDLGGAERSYRAAIAVDASFARGHAALAAVRAERGDGSGARAGFERALRLAPDLTEAAVALAVLEARTGNLATAEQRLQAALIRDPHNAEALLGQASVLARTGRVNEARTNVLRVLEREPGNQRALQFALQLTRAAGADGATR